MKHSIGYFSLLAFASLLAGCMGDGDSGASAKVDVDELATGAYSVSIGDIDTPTVGNYYASADGSRLLVVNDGEDKASRLYRRGAADKDWVAVPTTTADVSITLLNSIALPIDVVPDLTGSYVARIDADTIAKFSIVNGIIKAGDTRCELSGHVSDGALPNTLKLNLMAANCGSILPAASAGAISIDSDYAPAKFRMLADDGEIVVDLWAYAE